MQEYCQRLSACSLLTSQKGKVCCHARAVIFFQVPFSRYSTERSAGGSQSASSCSYFSNTFCDIENKLSFPARRMYQVFPLGAVFSYMPVTQMTADKGAAASYCSCFQSVCFVIFIVVVLSFCFVVIVIYLFSRKTAFWSYREHLCPLPVFVIHHAVVFFNKVPYYYFPCACVLLSILVGESGS